MNHAVVFQIVQQCVGYALGGAREEYRCARNARDAGVQGVQEHIHRHRIFGATVEQQLAPLLPGRQQDKDRSAYRQREPTAMEDLGDVGEQKLNEVKRMIKKLVNEVLNR